MKSYVPITFVFLAVAFYQLSGGADYAPRDGSLQAEAARARDTRQAIAAQAPRVAPAAPRAAAAPSDLPAIVTRAALTVDLTTPVPRVASQVAPQGSQPGPADRASEITPSTDSRLESYSLARLPPAPLTSATLQPGPDRVAQSAPDIRNVLKSRVNMRMGPGTQYDVVTKIDAGTQVQLLQNPGNGWVKLRVIATGRIGWMAESLVSAAN